MTSNYVIPSKIETTQILVVGAGPVGLLAGLCAARRGLEVTLLEQNFRGYSSGHATLLHPSSVRLLAEFGISPQLLAEGRPVDRVNVYIDGACAMQLELPLPALTLPQRIFEEILLKALRAEGAEFRSPCEATLVSQTAESVQVRAVRREPISAGSPAQNIEWEPVESSTFEAEFVIGADGYDSRVRTALGIDTASAGATETFAMFEGPQTRGESSFDLAFASGLGSVVLPLASQRTRWGFQLASEFNLTPDIGHLRAFLRERAPWQHELPRSGRVGHSHAFRTAPGAPFWSRARLARRRCRAHHQSIRRTEHQRRFGRGARLGRRDGRLHLRWGTSGGARATKCHSGTRVAQAARLQCSNRCAARRSELARRACPPHRARAACVRSGPAFTAQATRLDDSLSAHPHPAPPQGGRWTSNSSRVSSSSSMRTGLVRYLRKPDSDARLRSPVMAAAVNAITGMSFVSGHSRRRRVAS